MKAGYGGLSFCYLRRSAHLCGRWSSKGLSDQGFLPHRQPILGPITAPSARCWSPGSRSATRPFTSSAWGRARPRVRARGPHSAILRSDGGGDRTQAWQETLRLSVPGRFPLTDEDACRRRRQRSSSGRYRQQVAEPESVQTPVRSREDIALKVRELKFELEKLKRPFPRPHPDFCRARRTTRRPRCSFHGRLVVGSPRTSSNSGKSGRAVPLRPVEDARAACHGD